MLLCSRSVRGRRAPWVPPLGPTRYGRPVGGWPGAARSRRPSLAAVPGLLLAELGRAERGVVVLAVDGLSHRVAAATWPSARLTTLSSTFPSTSATAWLTALTGVGPLVHGVPGMVYRVGHRLVHAVTGAVLAGPPTPPPGIVRPAPTVFDRASATGVRCLTLGRELDHLPGPWAPALLSGATPVPPATAVLAGQAADPGALVEAVVADVKAVLDAEPGRGPRLLWVYVNLDDHVHANGYDQPATTAMRQVDAAARRWAARGWTVVAHSDHGQLPVRPDPALARVWAELDDPGECELPSGGAGRVRWLHPRPGRENALRARAAAALGDAAVILTPRDVGLPASRVGAVVAVAASPRFPVPDPLVRFEHGGTDEDEMAVPFAVWRPSDGRQRRHPTRSGQVPDQ